MSCSFSRETWSTISRQSPTRTSLTVPSAGSSLRYLPAELSKILSFSMLTTFLASDWPLWPSEEVRTREQVSSPSEITRSVQCLPSHHGCIYSYQELEVVQEDLGSGYTTVRKIDSGEYGFLPTTSLILHWCNCLLKIKASDMDCKVF